MAVFFFDIHDEQALPDRQGLDLANLAEAQAYALQMAASFLKQDPALFWRKPIWAITIRDETRTELYRMEFKLTLGGGELNGTLRN